MDKFIVKRIIKRVYIHIASVEFKKWSNLDYYALKIPPLVNKIISDTEDVIETKDKFLQDMHRIIVGKNRTENNKKTSKLVNKFSNFEEKKIEKIQNKY